MAVKFKGLVAASLLAVALLGGYAASVRAADEVDPSVDCPSVLYKDGTSWSRQGSGWIRTVPAPGGGTDQFSMANYLTINPIQEKTYNCSTGQWDVPPL